jgi:hypothetical protein
LRAVMAMARASVTSSVRMWSAIAQPTIFRENCQALGFVESEEPRCFRTEI